MTIEVPNPGWEIVSIEAKSTVISGVQEISVVDDVVKQGFGFEIIKGGQYVRKLGVIAKGGQEQVSEQEEWIDGSVMPCPNGFSKLRVYWEPQVALARQELVLRIIKRPAAVFVRESGIGAQGGVQLFESTLNLDGADTPVQIGAAQSAIIADVPYVRYMVKDAGAPASNLFRKRDTGDERGRWYPTPALFFGGFVGGTHAFSLYVMGYSGSASGAAGSLTVLSKLTSNTIALGATVAATYTIGLWLRELSPSAVPLRVPQSGFRLVLENTGAAMGTFEGCVFATSH